MAAIVSSNSVGLLNSSLYVLGSQGALGQATQGRAGEQVYVNGATGNLVIQNRDELLIGRGPDLSILRTYNSQGLLDGDNNDSWRLGVYRKVYNLTGTVNTAGSTVTRVAEDGSESAYTFDATLGKYVCHDGGGAYDTLGFTSANQTWIWSWTDGTNQLTERYDAANGGRITQVLDQDGNGLTFTYNAAGLITQVSDASGETTFLDYAGTNLTQLRTVNSSAQTLVRTRYAYDASNRLITVTTDLSPEDASIADGKTYVVSYTYDGTSKRVASLTQTDGNNLSFSYVQVGTAWKIQSYTDAAGKITSLAYTQTGASTTPASATANNAVLSTTETTTSTTTVAPYYTVQSGNTWASISQAVYGTSDANAVAALQSALGNPALTAGTRLTVPQTLNYTTTASSSANGAVLSTTTTTTVAPYYAVQSGNTWSSITQAVYGTSDANAAAALQTALGNPALTAGTRLTVPQTISYTSAGTSATANSAVLSTTITTSTNYNLVSSALTTPTVAWGTTASLLAGSSTLSAAAPQVKFDQNGNGMAVWALGADLFYRTYSKSNNLWSAAQTLDGTLTGNPGTPNLSMSANGNALVSWVQNSNLYARRYIAGVWDGASTIPNLENLTGAALNPVGAINDSGRTVVAFVQAVSTTNNLYANVFNGTAWQSAATVVDDIGTANANSITSTLPSVAIDSLNNATVLWLQKTGTQTVDSLYFSRFNPSTSTWGTPNSTTLENTTTAVTAASIAFDGNGNGIAIWLQGGSLLAKSYTRSSNAWSASTTLGTSASAPSLSLSANGNGLVTWVNAGNILTRRYTAGAWIGTGPTTIENLTGAASSPTGSINNAGQAVVAFVQADAGGVNNIYANRFTGGAWQSAATLIESNSNAVAATMTPSVAIDATGNVNALWLQKNGAQTTDSVFWNRFNTDTTPYYTLPGGASWSSIAAAVYGSSAPATQLQSALGNPALTAGNRLTGFPATLTVTTTSTVAPYYTVQAGNTWSSIAQTVYGDSAAAGPLQAALGNPTLAAGLNLTVPSSLSFTPVTAAANGAALSTTDTQTTSVSLNSAALTNPAGGWASPTAVETSSAAASQLLMKTSNGGDAVAVWLQGGSLFASAYDSVVQTWSAPVLASGTFTNISGAKLDVDHATGSAVLTWIDSTTNRVYANLGSWNGSSTLTWRGAQLVATATGTLAEAAGSPGGILLRTTSGTTQSLYFSFWDGTSFFSAPQLVATVTGAITSPQVVTTELGVIQIVWRASDGTAESLYTRSYDEAFWGGWVPGTTLLESSSTPVSLFLVETDIWADTNVAWVQGNDIYVNWGGDGQGWNGAVLVATSPSPISQFAYSDSAGSNAVFAWTTTDGKVYAARWGTAAELLATGTGLGDLAAYTNGSTVVVSWRAGNDLYATSHDGANWSTPALLETSSQPAVTPRVGVASGQPFAIWQQSDGTANSIVASRYLSGGTGSPYYTVQAGNTWASIAQLLYGNSAAASALQSAMGNPALTAGAQLTGFPATLSVTTTVTVPAYYLVPSGASWATVTQAVYGTSDANAQLALRDALGNPALTAGAKITMPASIRYAGAAGTTTASANAAMLSTTITTTVAPYYTVSGTDTWTSITQTVYGTSNANALAALQTALGNPALSAGLRLTVPATISYTANLSSAANNAVLSTTITTTTTATVAPYYTVQSGDTWPSIAQTVYGDSQAGSALQTALGGGASPTVGAHLTVPQSLSYTKTVAGGMRTDVTDPLGLMTSIVADGQGQITQILNPAVGGVRQSVTYAYDANGNVTSVTDARGLVTSYGYDANGNRMLERDAAGNTVTRVFGSKNELQTETSYVVPDPDGAGAGLPGSPLTTRYVYDVGGHLRFVVSGEGRVSEYRYNSFGQRIAAIQYTGSLYNLTGLTPTLTLTETQLNTFVGTADKTKSLRVDSTYDFRGQVASTTSYAKVDAAGTGIADGTQGVTQYVYDQAGNLLKTIDPRGTPTAAANDYATAYAHDGLGRLTSTTVYNEQGLPVATVDAQGRTAVTFYDDVNRKTVLTSANGLVTTSTYDAQGELVSVLQNSGAQGLGTTSYFYDADGRLRRTVDATGISTHILYDEAGRQIATIDGTGTLTEYRYDADNNLTRTIQYATAVTAANLALLVDAQGNPTTVTLAAIRPAASGQDRSTWAAYDSANRLVKSVDELGHVTQSFYDGAGRLTDVLKSAKAMTSTAALGDIPTPASINPAATDPLDRLTRNFYDADGKLRGTLDGEGYLVEYKYDAAGQLVETVGYATVTSAGLRTTGTLAQLIPTPTPPNPDDIHSHVLYNARGQVVGVVDGEGYLTETVYDLAGNKTQVVRYATKVTYSAGATVASLRPASNAQDQVSSFTYTALNQLASATDFENTRTDYTYDEVGNLTKTVRAVNTADVRTLNAQYDKQGRLTAELSGAGSALLTGSQTQPQLDAIWAANATKYAYDSAGRRVSSTDPNGNRTLYYYDADGHLTHSINAAGEVRENKYNVLGQLTQTIAYGTRLASTTLGTLTGGLVNATLTNAVTLIANAALDSVTAYSYTARGQVASSTDPLLFATTNTYDAFGDLTGSSQQIGAGQTLDHTYEFDRRGLLTRTLWDLSAVNAIELRQYDAFGRATQVTDANNNVRTQTYDRLGRVVTTSVDPGAGHLAIGTSTTYDAFDRVLTQRDALNNVTTFTYDKTNRSVTMLTPELVSVATVHNRQGETQSVTDGRGNITKYDYDLDGNLKQLTRTNAQGQAISTTVNLYDKADRLTDTVDANGNTVRFTYDAANRVLTRVVDPGNLNLTTTYEYDAKGHTTKVTDARGFATQTQFDLKGQVTSVIVDPGVGHLNLTTAYSYVGKKTLTVTEGAAGANPKVTKYTYDNLGRRIQEQVDPAGLNLTTTYTYDKKGNVVSKTEAVGKPEARTTRYVYDAADRLVWTIDALGDVRKNEYDANGHVTRTIAYAKPLTNFATLPAIPVASDVSSRLSASAGDQAVNHVFDRDGREVYTIDAMGGVTQKVYDAAGNVIQTTAYAGAISVPASPTPAGVAALVSAPNPDNRITRAVYDAANRAIFAIDAMGYVTQRFYDGAGNVSKEVKYWNALQGTFTAGSAPQILATAPVPPSGSWVIVDAVHDQTTRQFYDAAGRMRYGVNAEGYVTERRLDAMGNETARIRYADRSTVTDSTSFANMTALFPNVALNTLPATALVEQASYDNAGRVFDVTDGEGAVTRNLYDALGNKTDVIRAFGTSLASTTHYFYDAAGREREETAAYGTAVAATTRYVLDAFGNRTGIIDPRGVEITEQDTDWAKAERLRLNLFASVAALSPQEKTDLLASYTTTLAFDKAGRQTGSTIPAGFRVPGNVTTTVYDAHGNAVKITDPRGNSGYFYYDANDKARFHIDPMGYVTEYRYDAFGNVKDELHYANKMTGAYDENTTLADLASRATTGASVDDRQTSRAYDRVGQVSTITYQGTPTSYTEVFQYDAFGNKTQYKDKSDAVYNYEYDRVGNLKKDIAPATDVVTGISPTVTTLNTRLTTVYDYDAVGNRIKMTEASGITQVERVTVYKYDKLGRQTHIEAPAFSVFDRASGTSTTRTPVTDKTYDAAGNLVMQTAPDGGRVLNYYDALNRKVLSVDADNALHEYEYDHAGNLIRERTYDTRLTGALTWQTRPTAVNPSAYREMRYRYNANSLRTGSETRVETLWNFAKAQTQNGNGYDTVSVVTSIDYNANGDIIRTVDGNGNRTYQFYDAIGNRILQIDPLGYAIRREYNAEGQVSRETRYAVALPAVNLAALNAATTPASLASINPQSLIDAIRPPGTQENPDDRVTEFIYDRLGRVTIERNKAVGYASVNASNGALTELQGDLDTRYEYDGNGKIKAVILPNAQGRTDYLYDALGRRTQELDPQFQAFNAYGQPLVATREETHWAYDAFGEVAVQTKLGLTVSENRETRSQYDNAGRLRSQIDPEGATTTYDYDIAGNVVRKTWQVKDVDLNNHTYRCYYTYDHLNRQISYQDTEDEGSALPVIRETHDTRYNAHGDIEARGVNGQFQEQYKYDRLGRLFFTNKDNGTPRLYVYDANGNASVEVQAINTDLSTVGGVPVTGPGQVGAFDPNTVQLTFSHYDARNRLTEVVQPPMDYGVLTSSPVVTANGTDAAPAGTLTDLRLFQVTGSMTPSGQLSIAAPALPPKPADPAPAFTNGTQAGFAKTLPPAPAPFGAIPQGSLGLFGTPGSSSDVTSDSSVQKIDERIDTTTNADGVVLQVVKTVTERFTRTRVETSVSTPDANSNVTRTIRTTTDVIIRKTTFTANRTEQYLGTGDTFQANWTQVKTDDTDVDRRVDVTTDTLTWQHAVTRTPTTGTTGWVGADNGVHPGTPTYTLAGNIQVNTRWEEDWIPDGEGGYYWGTTGFYYVDVTGPAIDYRGGDPVIVTYVWENGAAVVPVQVTMSPDKTSWSATQRIRYDGHSIIVTKGNLTLAAFGMDRNTMTASVPISYALPQSVGVWTEWQYDWISDGEGGYYWGTTGYYYVHVNVPQINYRGSDPVYVTYIWENGAAVVSVPVDANGNATGLIRYDGHGIVVTKGGPYGAPGATTLASFGMDRDTFNASVQITPQPLPTIVAIGGLNAAAARVVFTPVGRPSLTAERYDWTDSGGTHTEFHVLGQLNPGDVYDYEVYDAAGVLLNRVHGILGATESDGFTPVNYNYYSFATQDKVTGTVTRVTQPEQYYRRDNPPTAPINDGQATYLANLTQLITQGATHQNVIARRQTYNAFGEVLSEIDGNNNRSDFTYNDLGKLVLKQDPAAAVHHETGAPVPGVRPTTHYYYDELGQLVGTQDAVSDLKAAADKFYSTRVLVNGRVEKEFDPYHNSKSTTYDRLGNRRLVTDEAQLDTEFRYDRDGRLTRVIRYDKQHVQYTYDSYEYDSAGERIAHTDGLGRRETYLYDGQGRIRRHVSFFGRQTRYDYNYIATIGGIGGYEKRTITTGISAGVLGNDVLIDQADYFGKIRYHKDLGGHEFTYVYNNAGWLKQQDGTTGIAGVRPAQHITYDYYQNGFLKSVADTGVDSFAQFEYDNNGNRTLEKYSQVPIGGSQPTPYQVARAEYDTLNRLTHVRDESRFDIRYTYDANGNRRSIESTYFDLLTSLPDQTQNFYYTYDKLNRFVITMGERDAAGNIVVGSTGYLIGYDAASRRTSAYSAHKNETTGVAAPIQENYYYDPINIVQDTVIKDLTTNAVRSTHRQNSVVGNLSSYDEYTGDLVAHNANPATTPAPVLTRHVLYTYDADNLLKLETTTDPLAAGTRQTQYDYLANGVLASTSTTTLGVSNAATVTLTYQYEYWDGYKEKSVTIAGAANNVYNWTNGTSTYAYDANGHIARLFDSQANRTLSYVNNHEGQVMKRFETEGSTRVIRNFYSLNGIVIGDAGTDRKESVVDYAQRLADYDQRTLDAYIGRNGATTHIDDGTENGYDVDTREMVTRDRNIAQRVFPVTSADFDQNYQPITDTYPAHTPQSYVTRSGDNLQSIALAVWGDASLWYLLADANGLTGTEQIPAGTRLTVPNVVTNIHNNSSTFKPYDPGFALGDTTPTLPDPPPPPRDEGCGTMGMIVVMVVVIIVCIFTEQWYLLAEAEAMAGAAAAAGDIMLTGEAVVASGAMAGTAAATEAAIVGAAAGNLAGQAVANMIGMQHGFSMESFMSSVLTAGIGGAIGQIGSGTWGQMATAAANNAIGQGVNIITGQQQKFDWRGVAAATVSAPVSNWAGKGFAEMTDGSRFAYDLASGAMNQGINVAAHRGRQRFNAAKVFADAFGRAIGASLLQETTLGALPVGRADDLSNLDLEQAEDGAAWTLSIANAEDAARDREGSSVLSDSGRVRTPGAEAARRGIEYALEAADPYQTPAAQSGGHMFLPSLIADAAGLSDPRLMRIIAFAQLGDQLSATDGFTNGTRYSATGRSYGPGLTGMYSEQALHALNGLTLEENLEFYHGTIAEYRDNDAVVGFSLHGIGDSIFHSREVNGVMRTFTAPLGHAFQGSAQDYVSRDQVLAVTGEYLTAFETITGNPIGIEQRAAVMTAVNQALNRAEMRTIADVEEADRQRAYEGSAPHVDPRERMELNFRDVVREMANVPGVQLDDLPSPFFRGAITPDGTIQEGRTFFRDLPAEQADALTEQAMDAAALITNRYNRLLGDTTGPEVAPNDFYDTRVWSLRRVIPGLNRPPVNRRPGA